MKKYPASRCCHPLRQRPAGHRGLPDPVDAGGPPDLGAFSRATPTPARASPPSQAGRQGGTVKVAAFDAEPDELPRSRRHLQVLVARTRRRSARSRRPARRRLRGKTVQKSIGTTWSPSPRRTWASPRSASTSTRRAADRTATARAAGRSHLRGTQQHGPVTHFA